MELIAQLVKFIKATPKTWLALFLASLCILCFPKLDIIRSLPEVAKSYVGIVFIISAAFLVR